MSKHYIRRVPWCDWIPRRYRYWSGKLTVYAFLCWEWTVDRRGGSEAVLRDWKNGGAK